MSGAEGLDWRQVVAALAHPDSRAVLAEIADDPTPNQRTRRRVIERLLAAGIIEDGPQGLTIAVDRLRATLVPETERPVGVERFLSPAGRILTYPARASERDELLALLAPRILSPGEEVDEPELTSRLLAVTEDVATLRRLMVEASLVERWSDGTGYRLVT